LYQTRYTDTIEAFTSTGIC